MPTVFAIPAYVPNTNAGETLQGYQVQSAASTNPENPGAWTSLSGSPFSGTLVVDPNGTPDTLYRVTPITQVTVGSQTVAPTNPSSPPFTAGTQLYDAYFTQVLLPAFRLTYLGDQGTTQVNGTSVTESTGAGNGVWVFDGQTSRFAVQYVMDDNPVKILEGCYRLVYQAATASSPTVLTPYVDYCVDSATGTVVFAVPPQLGDYARFEFQQVDLLNKELLPLIVNGVNAMAAYGLASYTVSSIFNLQTLSKPIASQALIPIICKSAILQAREGLLENAMRNSAAWRDGNVQYDPFPSRALEFHVTKLQVNEASLKAEINRYNLQTPPISKGEYGIFFNLTSFTPVPSGIFRFASAFASPFGIGGPMTANLCSPYASWAYTGSI